MKKRLIEIMLVTLLAVGIALASYANYTALKTACFPVMRSPEIAQMHKSGLCGPRTEDLIHYISGSTY